MELAFAAAISGDKAQSDIFSDLSLKQAPTSQIRETAFFNY